MKTFKEVIEDEASDVSYGYATMVEVETLAADCEAICDARMKEFAEWVFENCSGKVFGKWVLKDVDSRDYTLEELLEIFKNK